MSNVILMASGLGTRMRPLTDNTPKPLIKVHDIPMIETIIQGFVNKGYERIYVVVGYLKEQFEYLTKKYERLELIESPYYSTINNISSVYVARDVLKLSDTYICEADLYLNNSDILDVEADFSGYLGTFVNGMSDDWVFDTDEDGIITRVGKYGENRYNMVGISHFSKEDSAILKQCIEKAWEQEGYEDWFWDDVVNMNLDKLRLKVSPVERKDIIEIDTVDELEKVINELGC